MKTWLYERRPCKITQRDDPVLYSTPTAWRRYFPILPQVKQELQRLKSDDIIEKSYQGNGTELTHSSSKETKRRYQVMRRPKNI